MATKRTGIIEEKARNLMRDTAKKGFEVFVLQAETIGDDCRYNWHYEELIRQTTKAMQDHPEVLLNLFLSEYKDAFTDRQISTIRKRVEKYLVAKTI